MNNENADRILKSVADSLEGGTDFLTSQAGEVAEQVIMIGRVVNTSMAVFFLILFGILSLFTYASKKCYDDTVDGDYILGGILSAIFAVVFFALSVCFFYEAMIAWFAPKVYLLEYCKEFFN
jgi:hypothetical protein